MKIYRGLKVGRYFEHTISKITTILDIVENKVYNYFGN